MHLPAMICILLNFAQSSVASLFHARDKRTLLYPPPSDVLQVVMGVGLPLVLEDESVIVGLVLKFHYSLPTNISDYTNTGVISAKKKRSVSRWDLYELMSHIAELHGVGGKECILRAICEVAYIPLDQNKSLLEELVHTLFTPSSTQELLVKHTDGVYHAAEQIGKKMQGSCSTIFPQCQISLSDQFTRIYNF